MSNKILKLLIEKIKITILILKLQLQIKLLKQKRTIPNLLKPEYIMIHHGGDNNNFWQVNNYHKNIWNFKSSLGYYVGYHYWIEKYGKLYQARRDNERAAHCVEKGNPNFWNTKAVSICLQGNFENEEPTDSQLKVLKEWVDKKRKEYNIPISRVLYHGEKDITLCCGKNLISWFTNYKKSS